MSHGGIVGVVSSN